MIWHPLLYSSVFVLFLTGCFKKESSILQEIMPVVETQNVVVPSLPVAKSKAKKGYFTKEQREAIYFAASLEREALKLITKNNYYDKGTLFSALSFVVEAEAGVKRMFPANIDCSRFRTEKKNSILYFYKTCQKPEILAIEIKSLVGGSELDIEFKATEWSSVIGSSVALTNPNVSCQLTIRNKRLALMKCRNWAYLVTENKLSATEVKLANFSFDRQSELQFSLKGGFYKDLVENKKISILVPLTGQIKVIEKEIEVIDDFAEKPEELKLSEESKKLKPIVIGGPDGQKENSSQEIGDENHQAKQKNEQKNIEQGHAISEDRSQKQVQYENETREEIEREEAEQRATEEKRQSEEIRQNIQSDENNGGVPKNNGVLEAPNRSR